MSITKEQVQDEAKRLSLTLTDEQVGAYVLIGVLPAKAPDSGSHTEDDDVDLGDGDKGASEGVKKRIQQLAAQKKVLKEQLDAANKLVADSKKAQEEADHKKSVDKGEYEKLQQAADAKAKAADEAIAKAKQRTREGAVKSAITSELLAAGLPADRLDKALKLFPHEKVEFEWIKEEDLEYAIEDFGSVVGDFKKENDFLWAGSGDDADAEPASGYQGRRQPAGGSQTSKEKKREEMKRKHPELFS